MAGSFEIPQQISENNATERISVLRIINGLPPNDDIPRIPLS